MKLFVALAVPESLGIELAQIGPAAARGVGLVRPEQMHVTLHFVGNADPDKVRIALADVDCSPVQVRVAGTGRFGLGGGRTILWAGVEATASLLALHTACRQALSAVGFEPEVRRFVPHITLARMQPAADASIVDAFIEAGRSRRFGNYVAEAFVLYNSIPVNAGVRYEAITSFRLR